jgi:thermitase
MPPQSNSKNLLLAAASFLVLAFAWVLWQTVLSPPPTRETRLRQSTELSQSEILHAEDLAQSKQQRRAPIPLPQRFKRLTLDELRAALIGPAAVPGEAILTFRSLAALNAFKSRAGLNGISILHADDRLLSAQIRYSDLGKLADEINNHPDSFENIAANLVARIPGLPPKPPQPDPNNQGGDSPFDANELWQTLGGSQPGADWGRNVTVAVIDSGIGEHSSLNPANIRRIEVIDRPEDQHGHGTSMASLIAGSGEITPGLAPAARLLDIWVADEKGFSNTALLARGIMQAVDEGAQVINISLGAFGSSLMLQNAVQFAMDQGVIIVAAAGNEQLAQLAFPAAYPGVISVAAVDSQLRQAYFSNSGKNLTLAAPGVGITSAYPDNRVVIGSGTSQAAAITSGVIAGALSRGYRPSEILDLLKRSARSTGAPPELIGAGVIQIPPSR